MYSAVIRFFSRIGQRYLKSYLSPLKAEIKNANIGMLYEYYVGRMLFLSFLSFVLIFLFVIFSLIWFFGVPLFICILSGIITGATMFMVVLTLNHYYPYHLLASKRINIETNMPFAISHMAAISSSGVPPFVIFKLISDVKEYGEITNECKRIVKNIEFFGMDIISAVKNVADRTPSVEFRQFLDGVVANIQTGGDLRRYFDTSGKQALFDYRLKREKYLQTLSTYADFYTAVLIAAPLFFVSVLSIMSFLGGQILGMSIPTAMRLGVYIFIPVLNIAFILFIQYTQPSV
jgi:flagellar protein FlaJ